MGISTGQLKILQFVHPPPIKVIIYHPPKKTLIKESFSPNGRLSCLDVATRLALIKQPNHQGSSFPGPLVLRSNPFNFHTPTGDRDQTVSRRSKPNSRTTFVGEQPNPWNLLQLQDVMSRHRGAKRTRR